MKKKFKKVAFGTLLTALLLIIPIVNNNGVEEVKANEPNCTTHTNYYFFNLVAGYAAYDGRTLPMTRTHISYFMDDIPEGTKLDSIQYKWLDLKNGEDGWTIRKFWEKKVELNKVLDTKGALLKNGDEWYFAHAKEWFDDETGASEDTFFDASKYDIEDIIRNSYYNKVEHGNIVLKIDEQTGEAMPGSVKRTIGTDWTSFRDSVAAQSNGGTHPTDGNVWLPALLRATFQVCEGSTEPEPGTEPEPENDYNVILKYVDDETNEEIKEQLNVGNYKTGEDYSATCLDVIDEYQLVSEKKRETVDKISLK